MGQHRKGPGMFAGLIVLRDVQPQEEALERMRVQGSFRRQGECPSRWKREQQGEGSTEMAMDRNADLDEVGLKQLPNRELAVGWQSPMCWPPALGRYRDPHVRLIVFYCLNLRRQHWAQAPLLSMDLW